ncbi:MAG: PPOX class F420-dependent oxidoreductase [Candidatus Dormibacteria bacterium]
MNTEQARQFLTNNHRCVLATYRRDQTVQMSPVVAGVDEQGRVVISSREQAIKTKNLIRDPRAALVAFTDSFYGPWAMIWGSAEVLHLPGALPLLEDYYRRILGEHPNWDEYRQAMRDEHRVLLRLTISQSGPVRLG